MSELFKIMFSKIKWIEFSILTSLSVQITDISDTYCII